MIATQTRVAMKHGAGGRSMRSLIERVFLNGATGAAADMDDGAAIPIGDQWLIVTTDSHVIQPIVFPGGDIGRLSIAGTVNDLSMMGATEPLGLTCGIVIEEGFAIEELLAACRQFPLPFRQRMTFEYVLLDGVNDSVREARDLARLLKGIRAKINLIPFNDWQGAPFARPPLPRILAFQSALLERGITATVLGIRHPGVVRAIVNDAGFDLFDPQGPTVQIMRQILGGSPDATEANPDLAARQFEASEQMRPIFELMKQDQDMGQGDGYWRTYLRHSWQRCTTLPGYTYADFANITVPTLILSGDRDEFCQVEQAVAAYRQLPAGELAILAGHGHYMPPAAICLAVCWTMARASSLAVR